MMLSQESVAPSTESSNQLPPIPNSFPPIASPPPPSNPVPQSKTIDSKHILQLVARSKRPVIERTTQNDKDKFEIQNAFLPKELAVIIATRQHREQSTLVNFNDDIEKEEVEAFKAYLRLAIANFAAVDTSPTPRKVPTHFRPTKYSSNGSGKDKNFVKKVAIATPRIMMSAASTGGKIQEAHILPKKPQISQNTWATVARNGQKKAR
ncbi:hypothetical protein EPUL_004747, partial [Erysiphe pulchra]